MRRPLLLVALTVATAWSAGAQPLRLTDVTVPDSVTATDGARVVLPVQVQVYRSGVVCVRAPCPQAPPLRHRFRVAVQIDSVASATVHAERTFRAHSSHDIEVPLVVDLLGRPADGAERRLAGTVRLYLADAEPVDCRRFWIVINPRDGARRAPPLSESERRCPP